MTRLISGASSVDGVGLAGFWALRRRKKQDAACATIQSGVNQYSITWGAKTS